MWENPKTNWSSNDGITHDDLNRIEGNINALNNGMQKNVFGFGWTRSNDASNDGVISVESGTFFQSGFGPIVSQPKTKNLTNWVAGSGVGVGGMATGATLSANTWYYIFAIYNPTTDTVEMIFDDNRLGTNISVPGFTVKKRVNSFMTAGAGTNGSYLTREMYSTGDYTFYNSSQDSSQGL